MRRTAGQRGHAAEGAGQSDRESLFCPLCGRSFVSVGRQLSIPLLLVLRHVSALVDFECLTREKKHLRIVAELSQFLCCFDDFTPAQFVVIVEMAKQISSGQHAVQTRACGSDAKELGRLVIRVQNNREVVFLRRARLAGLRGETDHGHSGALAWNGGGSLSLSAELCDVL